MAACAVFLLFSCTSVSETAKDNDPTAATEQTESLPPPIVRGESKDPNKLEPQELLSVTLPVENPQYLNCSPWSKIKILSSVLDSLKLHMELSRDKKIELFSHIVDNLPLNGPDGVVRQVYMGQFFEDKSPLEIRIATITPGPTAKIKSDKIIIFMTNAVLSKDGDILRGKGQLIGLDENASGVLLLLGDQIAEMQFVLKESVPSAEEIEKMDSFGKVMVAQDMINDLDITNNGRAKEILESILAKGDAEMPPARIIAMLMLYNANLAEGNIPQAEALWAQILELSPQVPGDMTPENLEAINGTDLYIIKQLMANKS
ncbi:hypothetical protein [Gracilinema caldarium]|uniref:hypothetical protein n=1 Tax=Gracilinema caldarium TaxID=215591 RepID=UPI0026EA52F6|nr:hypothetical protein [Gracilinema caldarium]